VSQDYNTKGIVVRGFLPNLSLAYQNESAGYVGDSIFPIISGLNKEAKIYRNSRADAFRFEAGTRAPGGSAPIAETRADSVNIDPQNYSIGQKIPDELRDQASAPGNFKLQPEVEAVEYMMDQLSMSREKEVSNIIHTTDWSGNGVGGLDAEGNWGNSTEASDTMVVDLADGESKIVSETGKRPNTLFIDFPAWQKIKVSPFWLNKLNNTQFAGNITPQAIANTLNYEIIIGWSVENTAQESTDIDNMTSKYIMSSSVANNLKGNAMLFYKPSTPGLRTLSAGYQYRLRNSRSGQDILMTKWRDDEHHSDRLDAQQEFDISVMCAQCAVLWKDTALT